MQTMKLKNGVEMPQLGFGAMIDPAQTKQAVLKALQTGYRLIDTAASYRNEDSVGAAIRESGIPRDELFITSKVWNSERGYDKTMAAFEKTMEALQLEYLDLYLIHWPASSSRFSDWNQTNLDTWKALTELYKAGRIHAIGVANFMPHHLASLLETEIPPMVDQIECHPGHLQEETIRFCREHDILVEAWSPLGGTGPGLLDNEALVSLAAKYQKSVAQICIRWCIQYGVLPLPRSATPSRIIENQQVFDFAISDQDMENINALPSFGYSGLHPDQVEF